MLGIFPMKRITKLGEKNACINFSSTKQEAAWDCHMCNKENKKSDPHNCLKITLLSPRAGHFPSKEPGSKD